MLVISVLVWNNKSDKNLKKENDEDENKNQIERKPKKNKNNNTSGKKNKLIS